MGEQHVSHFHVGHRRGDKLNIPLGRRTGIGGDPQGTIEGLIVNVDQFEFTELLLAAGKLERGRYVLGQDRRAQRNRHCQGAAEINAQNECDRHGKENQMSWRH